jgi:hypothetical protein
MPPLTNNTIYMMLQRALKQIDNIPLEYSSNSPYEAHPLAILTTKKLLGIMKRAGDSPPDRIYRTAVGGLKLIRKYSGENTEMLTIKPNGSVHYIAFDVNDNVISESTFTPSMKLAKAMLKEKKDVKRNRRRSS